MRQNDELGENTKNTRFFHWHQDLQSRTPIPNLGWRQKSAGTSLPVDRTIRRDQLEASGQQVVPFMTTLCDMPSNVAVESGIGEV